MKYFILVAIAIVAFTKSFSQSPVDWNFSSKKINASTYEIHLTAKIEGEWHTYSQTTPDGGPVPTTISFSKNPLVTLKGAAKEVGKLEKHFEELFGVEVKQFSDKVDFVQTVTVKAGIKTSVNGSVSYMVCNDRECQPPATVKFSILLK